MGVPIQPQAEISDSPVSSFLLAQSPEPGDPPPHQGTATPSPSGPLRRLRTRLLGRYTDYIRRYLTASVEHRLGHLQDSQRGLHSHFETLTAQNATLGHQLNALTAQNATLGHQLNALTAQNATLGHQLAVLIGATRADITNVREAVASIAPTVGDMLVPAIIGVREAVGSVAPAVGDMLVPAIMGVRSDLDSVSRNVEELPGLFGPRFDELEIKVRPLIAFDDTSYAVRLRDGYAMVPKSEPVFATMVANATSAGLEPGTRRVLQALIEPGMVVADVGANVGLLTLACAVATGPRGRVHAFEPEAGPRSQIEKTVHLNGLSWVRIHDLAVGAATEKRTFHVSPVIGHSSLYALPEEDGHGRDIEVQVTRLDDVVSLDTRLDVVKIDVEGAELDVLAGMRRVIAENPDLAIVAEYGPSHLARLGLKPRAWLEAFRSFGFEAYAIEEPTGVCRKINVSNLADVISVNLVFVKPKGQAKTRLPR